LFPKKECCVRLDVGERAVASNSCEALGSLKANVYTQTIKREDPSATETATNKIVTNGANVGFDTPLFGKHTLKYGVNWRKEKSKPLIIKNKKCLEPLTLVRDVCNERREI